MRTPTRAVDEGPLARCALSARVVCVGLTGTLGLWPMLAVGKTGANLSDPTAQVLPVSLLSHWA